MIFLRRFWTTCDAFLRRLAGRPLDGTAFTRFVFDKRALKEPEFGFMPPESGELSVCQVLGRSVAKLWRLRRRIRPGRTLRGRLDFNASAVTTTRPAVELVVDHAGFRGHATIRGWASDKPTQMIVAKQIARAAVLHRAATN